MHHAFLLISLPSLHDHDVKMSNFTFYRERKQATTNFSFSFLTWVVHGVPKKSTPGKFAYILHFWRTWNKCKKFEKTPVAVVDAKALHFLRKQPTFRHAITGFHAKWHLWDERRNSILMTRHYPDPSCTSDSGMKQIFNQSEALPRSG